MADRQPLGAGYAGIPPGPLSAYLGVRSANEQRGQEDVQTAVGIQGLLAKQQAMQEIEEIKKVMQGTAGDPHKAIAALLQRGSPPAIELATRLKVLVEKPGLQQIGAGGAIGPGGEMISPMARPVEPRPQSIGAGGLRLPSGEIVPPAMNPNARPATESAPVAVVGPDGKQVFTTRAGAIGKEPAPRSSIAGSGTFTPQALEFVAKQYLRGDRQAVQGFARNATARIALQNAIVDEAAKQGMSPEQTAAQMAEFAGTVAGSRTVGQRAANISLAATEAEEMLGIVKETSDKFSRTDFVPWNIALKAWESGTGTPEIAAFGASVNALVNVYARAINPTGVPTVSDKEHARAVLNTVQFPAQVEAVLGIIRRELEIAKKAPQQVREAIRGSIAPQTSWDTDKEKRYQEYKAKNK